MTSRLAVLGALTALLLGALTVLTVPAASAAWGTTMRIHGGKLQVCKVGLGDGRVRIKTRLDNRGSAHTHLAGLSRTHDGKTVKIDFRTAAGGMSATRSLIWRAGDTLIAGMGETDGQGAGGDLMIGDVPRC